MVKKIDLITELYDIAVKEVTANPGNWLSFLKSACRNYRLPFDEQLLIHVQRPDASAVLLMEDWNKKFGRWVKSGSKGIAVFDKKASTMKLKYYFDISDTKEGKFRRLIRPISLWQVNEEYRLQVQETLVNSFGVSENVKGFEEIIIQAAKNIADDNLTDYMKDILSFRHDSFLEELDEYSVEVEVKNILAGSIAYMVMVRCGLETEDYIEMEDFQGVADFNTPELINLLGAATSDMSEMALGQIADTIRKLQAEEKRKNRTFAGRDTEKYNGSAKENSASERGFEYERNQLQQAGRLSSAGFDRHKRTGSTPWEVRLTSQELSERTPLRNLHNIVDTGETKQTLNADTGRSTGENGTVNVADGGNTGNNGRNESQRPDGVAANDEQYPSGSGGNSDERTGIQLGEAEQDAVRGKDTIDKVEERDTLPSVEEQKEIIAEAEEEKASAFSISQEDIDSVLVKGSGFENGKYRIYRQFVKREDRKKNIAFLKNEYKTGGGSCMFADGSDGNIWYNGKGITIERKYADTKCQKFVLSWSKVEKRLGELIRDNRYLNVKEKEKYGDYLESISAPQYEIDTQRKLSRQRFIESHKDMQPADKRDTLSLRLSDFIRDLDGYEKDMLAKVERTDLADITSEQMEQHFSNPVTVQQLIDFLSLVQGGTSSVYSRSNAYKFIEELKELYPLQYLYHEGDIVYIGADSYIIATLSESSVYLQNEKFPIFSKNYSRIQFEEILKENPANDHLKVIITESQKVEIPTEEKTNILRFSIGFSEHPAFYDMQMKDRFTDLSFALGNKLLGILDEKQHCEREIEDNHVGWYHKTDFTIHAVIAGEEFNYEGQFDIGDGEGDLLAHIKNFYDYSLSTDCMFVTMWKEKGEDYYQEQIENLQRGQKILVPFLEQHAEITLEDKKMLDEIMATEPDWFHRGKETIEDTKPDETFIPDSTEEQIQHYSVEQTSDAFEEPFVIRDNAVPTGNERQYYAVDGVVQTFGSEEDAKKYADRLNNAKRIEVVAKQDTVQQTEQVTQDNSELIGKEITIDNRKYVIENIGSISGDVSMRDITFNNSIGFPINRVEKIGYVRSLLEQQVEQKTPAEKEKLNFPSAFSLSGERHNYHITDRELGYGTQKEKFRANIAAIQLLKKCESEGRYATQDEQEVLAKYVGWGGLSDAFDETKSAWGHEYLELKTVLTQEEYAAARQSTLTAFYTPPVVVQAIYQALENMGLKSGNILEPSCGTGNFIGIKPESLSGCKAYGVELDSISGRIATQLYQESKIIVSGYEEVNLPDSFFDVAVGNVPFGQFKVSDKKYDKHNFLIHDFFFAKTLDKVRPGGVIAFITSSGTLDKKNPSIRKYIAQRAELLGAIRLPNNTFKKNAGTEVTSDILFLQKRDSLTEIEPDWVYLDTDENGILQNRYFVEHPEMVLGEMAMESTQYGVSSTCRPYEGKELAGLLNEAILNIDAEIIEYKTDDLVEETDNSILADPSVANFSYAIIDDRIYYRENSRMKPVELSVTGANRVRGMIAIRDCVRKLIEYQTEDYTDKEITDCQNELNQLYDNFQKKYGILNARANKLVFSEDSSYPLLCSLEIVAEDGTLKRKADMFYKRTIKPHQVVTKVDTASEALALSLSEKACVNMEYMCSLTGKSEGELEQELESVIFRLPEASGEKPQFIPQDEYLSGNVREKLRIAKLALQSDEKYKSNVEALEKVQPKDLTASEISVRLGATWLPVQDIKKFIFELLGTSTILKLDIQVNFSKYTGEWNIEGKSRDKGNVKANNTYGTHRANAYKIIEDTLNLRDTRIYDYIVDEDTGKKKAILNEQETAIAQGKQDLIKQAFQDWIWAEPERRQRLTSYYNEKFNAIRPREYDGSHLNFFGMNPEIQLRQHQKNGVARIIYGGNTLLAYVVGAGKTYTMVAAAMESKRLGLCSKSMVVVPNHIIEQFAAEWLQLYPASNILVATNKDFETKNRKKFCARIATSDIDAVIIGHSQYEKIPLSVERQQRMLERQINEIVGGIKELKLNNGNRFTVKQLEKTKKSLEEKLKKLNDQSRKDDVVTFEELGIDRLFVDEADSYKNLFLYTKMRNVAGIAQTEAQKSSDMFMKCQYLDEMTGGKGVVFATGTPVSNSMVELYTMQRYLQYGTLLRNNLQNFDAWASTFGETVAAIELAPEGTGYRLKTRFARFYNLPELMTMFREVADIQTADMLNLPVPEAEYRVITVKPSEMQKDMVTELGNRAERVRNREVDATQDNMLKITNDGRKLALDQRLTNELLPDVPSSKVNACVEEVYKFWEKGKDKKLTQLLFCDLSTPKNDGSFSVYNDVRDKLIAKGIPPEEIEFIHNANTEVKKKELFSKVRRGAVRVLMGSTFKMGAGMNVQDLIIASHDLDCPWRPRDVGRILRTFKIKKNVEVTDNGKIII